MKRNSRHLKKNHVKVSVLNQLDFLKDSTNKKIILESFVARNRLELSVACNLTSCGNLRRIVDKSVGMFLCIKIDCLIY